MFYFSQPRSRPENLPAQYKKKTLWMMGYEQKTVDLSNIILKIILLEKIYPSNN